MMTDTLPRFRTLKPSQSFLNGFSRVASLFFRTLYFVLQFSVVVFFAYPVSLALVISAWLLDPSVSAVLKQDFPQFILNQFTTLFQYSVVFSLFIASLVVFARASDRVSRYLKTKRFGE